MILSLSQAKICCAATNSMMCELNGTHVSHSMESPAICGNVDVRELINIDNVIFQSHLRVMFPIELTMAIIGFIENVISLAALLCIQRPWKPFHYILINIALADLIYMGLTIANCVLIVRMQVYEKPIKQIGNFDCSDDILEDMCRHFTLVPLYCTTGAVISLYLAVTQPLKYRSLLTKHRITIVMSLCYAATIGVYISLHARYTQFKVYWYIHDCWTYLYDHYLQASSLYLGVSCLVLFAANILLWCLIVRKARSPEATHSSGRIQTGNGQRKKKLFATVSVLLATNVIFWTPAVCTFFFIYYMALERNDPVSVDIVIAQSVTSFVSECNSLVNPIIYGIRLPDVRLGYRRLALKLLGDEQALKRLDEVSHVTNRGLPLNNLQT
ncbi:melanocortin receptor 4 [Lingula anatina]|uniref:Melanocortin receptor 4 n=1 Tax=Lingula anatina TaxID=7574 RepID=A0A1S3JZN0_LINAN|nr:melanocortin receptor 4 [Lingula anatina]|eukprot:XP_013415845.1 melanocortin receptor 4 [Lingula anatina]